MSVTEIGIDSGSMMGGKLPSQRLVVGDDFAGRIISWFEIDADSMVICLVDPARSASHMTRVHIPWHRIDSWTDE